MEALDQTEFLEFFINQFDDPTREDISIDTEYTLLKDWTSMQALIVLTSINENYGVTLKIEDYRNQRKVQDLFKLVRDHTGV